LVDDRSTRDDSAKRGAAGAERAVALVTREQFTPGAYSVLKAAALDRIVVTDAASAFRLDAGAKAKLETLPAAPLVAEAIRRLHAGETRADLLVF